MINHIVSIRFHPEKSPATPWLNPFFSPWFSPSKTSSHDANPGRFGAVPPAMSSWALGGLPVAQVPWLPPASVGRGSTAAAPGPLMAAVDLTNKGVWLKIWIIIGFNGDLTNQNEVFMGFNET